jgi:hypothetical protein
MKRREFAQVKHETHCFYHDGDKGNPKCNIVIVDSIVQGIHICTIKHYKQFEKRNLCIPKPN